MADDERPQEFFVPGQPVPKGRPRMGKGGCYTPQRTKDYEKRVWVHAKKAGCRKLSGSVHLELFFHMNRPSRADVDNLAKSVLDGLNGVLYNDDRQITTLSVTKVHVGEIEQEPGVNVWAAPDG